MLIGWGAVVERAPHPLLISRACLRILSRWSSHAFLDAYWVGGVGRACLRILSFLAPRRDKRLRTLLIFHFRRKEVACGVI
jgi:hypothetical protein